MLTITNVLFSSGTVSQQIDSSSTSMAEGERVKNVTFITNFSFF